MIITIAGEKGGVAKSVTALSLAAAIHKAGHGVALVDVDPQASLTMYCEPIHYLTCHAPALADLPRLLSTFWADETSYVIIDTPSRLGPETQTALQLSDIAIITVAAEYAAVQQLEPTLRFVQQQPNQPTPHILLTRFDARSKHSSGIEASVRRNYKRLVYSTCIRETVAVKDSNLAGQTILDYAPRSLAARGYQEIAKSILKESRGKR